MSMSFYAIDKIHLTETPSGFLVPTVIDLPDEPHFDQAHARLVLSFLGLGDNENLCGDCTLDEFYTALHLADIFFQDEARHFTREREQGKHWISFGIDESQLRERLTRLHEFYTVARAAHATHIAWSEHPSP